MIVRTYARRSRGGLSDVAASTSPPLDPSSSSSETPFRRRRFSSQEPYGLLSSQESSLGRPNPTLDDPYAFLDDLRLLSPPSPSSPPSSSQEHGDGDGGGLHRRSSYRWGMAEEGEHVGSTLMEAQECGEMMEHMDEVNFALDGLRPSQPVRVRRASLLSLLSVSAGAHQRRLLRAQGTMKKIVDAVLGLNFDDSPSIIASAALFYVLASDAQDDLLLESPACVQFLIKLLNPPTSDEVRDKVPSVGSRLLLIRPPELKNGTSRRLDSGATSIISKVQEILLHCNEIKPPEHDEEIERPELTAKWIGLLTMEKACLSTVSLEDIYGTTKKVDGDFKEKLREFNGLDAVIDIAVACYSNMEGNLKREISTAQDLKEFLASENVVLFLKCLKIMENATFLSTDNQHHLLEMTLKLNTESGLSCVELIIHAIEFFSGLLLQQMSSPNSHHVNFSQPLAHTTADFVPEKQSKDGQENHGRISTGSSTSCPGVPQSPPSSNVEVPPKRRKLSHTKGQVSLEVPESSNMSGSSVKRVDDTAPIPCKTDDDSLSRGSSINIDESKGNSFKGSNKWISINGRSSSSGSVDATHHHFPNSSGTKMISTCTKKSPTESKECSTTSPDGHFDPFAFDENELGPSKWDSLTMPKKANQTHKNTATCRNGSADKKLEEQNLQCTYMDKSESDGFGVKSVASYDESLVEKDDHPKDELHAGPSIDGGDCCVLEDCLLSAVKVLINLTNDNLIGCQQIGSSGGLDTMASLIVNHFPAFDSKNCQLQDEATLLERKSDSGSQMGKRLSDHELDFLVAILGLLVNLVEKDSNNRSRLVCTSIPASQVDIVESEHTPKDVIHLLCSIFLVNKGPQQTKENNEITLSSNNETSLLQGEREAEMMIVEAYAALLLAFLSTESKKTRERIADYLPSRNLRMLVPVLERFVEFHLSLKMISPETHTAVSEVIESCRVP